MTEDDALIVGIKVASDTSSCPQPATVRLMIKIRKNEIFMFIGIPYGLPLYDFVTLPFSRSRLARDLLKD